jgi:hypothetical protein
MLMSIPEIMAHLYFVNISLVVGRGEIKLELKGTPLNSRQDLYQIFFCAKQNRI